MPNTITAHDLRTKLQAASKPQLVDVRSASEYAAGHVPGTMNIPFEQIDARAADLSDGEVILICQSGQRACMAEALLSAKRGNVTVLQDGTDGWLNAGMPLVSTTATRWSLDRQVRLGAGLLVLTGTVLAALGLSAWLYVAMFIGAGLTFSGLTNFCGMASLLALMPWNKPQSTRKTVETARS